ncbi:hypothetical protein OIU76_020130 [Salix suchowensis]|nr:hypothetical protein OIU76_020130 [Salix suchowensis]
MKPRRVSPEMADFVGAPEVSRTQVLKLIWAHIKESNLQVYLITTRHFLFKILGSC